MKQFVVRKSSELLMPMAMANWRVRMLKKKGGGWSGAGCFIENGSQSEGWCDFINGPGSIVTTHHKFAKKSDPNILDNKTIYTYYISIYNYIYIYTVYQYIISILFQLQVILTWSCLTFSDLWFRFEDVPSYRYSNPVTSPLTSDMAEAELQMGRKLQDLRTWGTCAKTHMTSPQMPY